MGGWVTCVYMCVEVGGRVGLVYVCGIEYLISPLLTLPLLSLLFSLPSSLPSSPSPPLSPLPPPLSLTPHPLHPIPQEGNLSAVDILSVANLVNYFGKAVNIESIEVSPLLLQVHRRDQPSLIPSPHSQIHSLRTTAVVTCSMQLSPWL